MIKYILKKIFKRPTNAEQLAFEFICKNADEIQFGPYGSIHTTTKLDRKIHETFNVHYVEFTNWLKHNKIRMYLLKKQIREFYKIKKANKSKEIEDNIISGMLR